ncbi:hypothetical protein LUZ61_020268 [Rhynchospora tenuis]|uniref:Uncharacterized protein n=1 Tax=Rhynchospora tenuis TaxID=198213 RepID=A0AAD5ZCR4_9POAL|nr:hypothetical protein LUZ61_020268 [Rhynchospora tenuis]
MEVEKGKEVEKEIEEVEEESEEDVEKLRNIRASDKEVEELRYIRESLVEVGNSLDYTVLMQEKEPFIISWLPEYISQAGLYEPRIVSIGPNYRNFAKFPNLEAINFQKSRLLRSFLLRNREIRFEDYFHALRSLEVAQIYYNKHYFYKPDEIVQELLLDGCFILELFFKWLDGDANILEKCDLTIILSDLLLIGNQIPFSVIKRLFIMVTGCEGIYRRDAFLNLFVKFLMNDQGPSHISLEIWPKKIYHILDLYHYYLKAPYLRQEDKKNDQTKFSLFPPSLSHWKKRPPRQIPGAVELYEGGVKFKRKSSFRCLCDVKFDRGILEIPPLQIDSNEKIHLKNLLALEKLEHWRNPTATSYVTLMDSLINTKEDVALLQHAGVIHNKLSSHQEAAIFFNQLGENLSVDNLNPYFVELFKKVQQHYDSSWNQSWARLMHDYFNSPWAMISVIAGVILLGLSVTQAFFTIYPYYRPRS